MGTETQKPTQINKHHRNNDFKPLKRESEYDPYLKLLNI